MPVAEPCRHSTWYVLGRWPRARAVNKKCPTLLGLLGFLAMAPTDLSECKQPRMPRACAGRRPSTVTLTGLTHNLATQQLDALLLGMATSTGGGLKIRALVRGAAEIRGPALGASLMQARLA